MASASEIRQNRLKVLQRIYEQDGIEKCRLMMLKMGLCWHTRRDYMAQLEAIHTVMVV